MIRHVVLWKLKSEAIDTPQKRQETLATIRKNHLEMQKASPYIKRLQMIEGVRSGNDLYEFGALMDFDSVDSIDAHRASSAHNDPASMAFCQQVRERKAVIDYEVPDP